VPLEAIASERKAALEFFAKQPVPQWRRSGFWTTSVKDLDLDGVQSRYYDAVGSREALPNSVRALLGDGPLAALIVLRGDSVVYTELSDEAAGAGVIACSLEDAFEQHGEIASAWYGKRVSHTEGKFVAANAALWSGGAFVYVPPDVSVSGPLQIVNLIDEAGTAQYARTLVVIDRGSKAAVREFNVSTDFDGQALHAGVLEMFVRESANARLASLHDWSNGDVYDVSTKRVEIARDAHCSWFPIHLGGRLTKQTLDIVTAERGADMRHNGVYFAQGDEHLDVFTTDLHEQGNTTGDTVWRGVAAGRSRASYEGLIEIVEGAQGTNTYLQTHSVMLSREAKIDAIPSLVVKTDDVSASHGGTVGEIDEQQVFYMRSRGITRAEAIRVLVEGFFEPVVSLYEDEWLESLVRTRVAEKLAAAGDDIATYAASK
jgi:Fe-S cluster assembly protein SufD